jgi:molybdopterin-synthase adenylyltransferase
LDHSYIGGHFDRQVRIHEWDQKMLEKQHVTILGVGGLGSIVLMALLRLGVKKVYLVDYDVVDNHNMNRQLMFSVKDIDQKKVDCAIKNAEFHNVGGT